MAKTTSFIAEYQTVIKKQNFQAIDFDNAKPPKKTIKRFIRLLKVVDDDRAEGMIEYPLAEIIVIAFLAILSNANSWIEIAEFGQAYKKWLKKFLKLENGIPSHDTFQRVFSLIDSKQLEAVTVLFLTENIERIKRSLKINSKGKRLICVDGKEARGTGRNYNTSEEIKNLQTLHVYDASYAICLFSEMIDQKTNEIPVAQSILNCMELKNTVVTFDALNTQKKTCRIIIEQKGDYVGALKGNHEGFESEVQDFFSEKVKVSIEEKNIHYYETLEKKHNQVERRRFFLTKKIAWFEDLDDWKGLRSFICYEKSTEHLVTGKRTKEVRYYISSLSDVELCADAIRGHWGIENNLHWHLDVSFSEDDQTTLDKNAFNNFSLLNKMTLSLLKLAQPLFKGASIRRLRKRFGWVLEDSLATLLNFFDEKDLVSHISSGK